MVAVSLRFGLLATALLALILGASVFDAGPAPIDRSQTVYAMPGDATGQPAMKMGMLGMGSCAQSGAGGMAGCTMQSPCSHCSQITRLVVLDIIAPAPRPDFSAAGPPLPASGRSPAPNPAPPKPRSILT